MVYAPRAKEIYQSMGIDHTKKSIIYSDALTVEKALKIKEDHGGSGRPQLMGVSIAKAGVHSTSPCDPFES